MIVTVAVASGVGHGWWRCWVVVLRGGSRLGDDRDLEGKTREMDKNYYVFSLNIFITHDVIFHCFQECFTMLLKRRLTGLTW